MRCMQKMIFAIPIMLLVVSISTYFIYFEPRSWGDDGDLVISISTDKTEINITDTINVTFTFHNDGDSDLRIVPPMYHTKYIQIYDSNNTLVKYIGPLVARPLLNNDDLETLKSNDVKSYSWSISNSIFDIRSNETYRMVGHYPKQSKEDITLPFWTQELFSREIIIQVN